MELDDAYANAAHIPGADTYPERWAIRARDFRQKLAVRDGAVLGVAYGPGRRQKFDLFYPRGGRTAGLSVFVHGGYWLRFDRSFWSHLAAGPLAHGWAVAMPSYDLCPDVRISDITGQVARAIEVSGGMVEGPVVLTGHSAGGHLVARMCVAGVLGNSLSARLAQVVPISPLADLRPLLKTSMNAQFGMDMAAAEAESPVLLSPMAVPVTVWVGEDERPAFLDQARWLAEAWNCGQVIAPGKHHFDVIEALEDAESKLVKTLIGL